MDSFDELNSFYEYKMSGGDSDHSGGGGGSGGGNNGGCGCLTLLILGILLYAIFSLIGNNY
ncbi:MAG: hypothetical protein Q8882_01865 [Bacillota bacterium]|nr:hypothetical protein [Bacillota bacterium]